MPLRQPGIQKRFRHRTVFATGARPAGRDPPPGARLGRSGGRLGGSSADARDLCRWDGTGLDARALRHPKELCAGRKPIPPFRDGLYERARSVLSVIIPANNEAYFIGACLDALLASELSAPAGPGAGGGRAVAVEVLVMANGCTDDTVAVAERRRTAAEERGWQLVVVDLEQGGKLKALNAGDARARGEIRVYLDADVTVSPPLLAQIRDALDRPEPAYASGRPTVAPAQSWVSRAYGRIFARVPFMSDVVPGVGVFALNAAGRARWGAFPDIIADDTFVRLNFTPDERIGVPASYDWPVVEGFGNLVRVRRRQNLGVTEVERLYPALLRNDDKPRMGLRRMAGLALRDPVGFCVYAGVALAVRLPAKVAGDRWVRGR